MQQSIAAAKTFAYKCWSLRSQLSTQAQKIQDQLSRLKQVGESFGSNLMVENYQMKRVEFIAGPSVEGQSAATRNLNEILRLLEDDKVYIIGVVGPGGVGKTTLVKNLNNELLKINVSNSKLSFGVVVWVTVPKPPIDIKKIQAQIVSRLNLKVDNEGSEVSIASKILERLKQEKSFLVILDDVWDAINLDHVGVPQPKAHTGSKVIITSRFGDVCKMMKTDTEMNISTLKEDESWQLFIKTAGDVANRENIQPIARDIARECGGLPLAITVIGACMSGKNRVEEWVDALDSLRISEPYEKDVIDEVYKVIKLSFDYLESPDTGSKRRGDIKSCFLYCSLYPVDIPTEDLIHCWWAEGFLGEHDTYEKAYNRGNTIIGSLKNACLLEADGMYCVKMHDVIRDVAKWIANTFGDEHISVFQAGIGLTEISHTTKVSAASVKRISFASNKIEYLPDCFMKCPKTTSLLLQDNESLVKIPDKFFLSFPVLRVLNLSGTGIRALPCSINELRQLHALILQNCSMLKELPSIGNLCNLQLLDCDRTMLRCLPEGMDKLTNLRVLNMPNSNLGSSIGQGFFLKFSSIEIVDMMHTCLGATSFDELSSLRNLTGLFITLDSSSIFNRDHTWMKRLKRFSIEVGKFSFHVPFDKSRREIIVHECETFSNGELSSMLQFASHLQLVACMGLSKLIANQCFNGLKSLYIINCRCDFGPVEEGSGKIDPLPNLEYLSFYYVDHLKSVSDFGHFLGLRFSKLRKLDVFGCDNLTCLFNVGGAFSVPRHLEEISLSGCDHLTELLAQFVSSQTTLVSAEIPRVRKLSLENLPKLATFGEAQSMWEHLEELKVVGCNGIRKLPLSIQTSNNIKVIRGSSEWWSQLEWDDHNYKSNLEHCFTQDLPWARSGKRASRAEPNMS
ncbi:disease resistance protein At4g27190-like [Solanum tuberosum]|uniref:disease resistance protein At4g27190-like n=1 Tax=Solanum tuberosum TaxID=4113 RepID=UPI0003D2459F|nr:PREDICTED: disease resistance protein At4g27190-like [Solanum tuberosum]